MKTHRIQSGTMWAIRHNQPVLVSIVGVKRAWYELRSGGVTWKEQSPRMFAYESQALWHCMTMEVQHHAWYGWEQGRKNKAPIDTVRRNAVVERMFDYSCRYWRAMTKETGGRAADTTKGGST